MKRISEMTYEEIDDLTSEEMQKVFKLECDLMTPQERANLFSDKQPEWMKAIRRQRDFYVEKMPKWRIPTNFKYTIITHNLKCGKCKHYVRFYGKCTLLYPDKIPEEVRLREDCERFEEK